ncbi:MAG TPA: hypothetical protein VN428_04340 [Bryobacteraceae bacterium]|nr:hypothetical protein [Bryobacteraceae bacterium]
MKHSNWVGLILGLGVLAHTALGQTIRFRFDPLSPGPPNAVQVFVLAINDRGNIAGVYFDSATSHGFYLDSASSDAYTTVEYPGAAYSVATGINDKKEISGYYGTRHSGAVARGDHGFILSDGRYITIDYPGSAGTRLYGINNAGDAVGESLAPSTGFIYTKGQFRTVTCPGGTAGIPRGMNNKGQVVGFCAIRKDGGTRKRDSFLLSADGVLLIDYRAPWLSEAEILPNAVNDSGDIVGWYFVEGERHGFLLNAGPNSEFIPVDNDPATLVNGINSKRQIVGFSRHSFVGHP